MGPLGALIIMLTLFLKFAFSFVSVISVNVHLPCRSKVFEDDGELAFSGKLKAPAKPYIVIACPCYIFLNSIIRVRRPLPQKVKK